MYLQFWEQRILQLQRLGATKWILLRFSVDTIGMIVSVFCYDLLTKWILLCISHIQMIV